MRTTSSLRPLSVYVILLLIACFPVSLKAQLPPVISDIPDQQISEGGTFETIDLNEMVSDPDNSDEQLTWNHSESVYTINIENNIATVITPDENWYGSDVVTFSVTDPDFNTSSDEALFEVIGVNDPPVLLNIPGQEIDNGESFAVINLNDYVEDVDNTDAELNWTASVNDNLIASIDGENNATILTTSDGWTGTQSITFTVSDPSGLEDADDADFIINSVNAVPDVADDDYTVDEGGSISTPAPGVLSNDSDADGDPMSATPVSNPDFAAAFDLNADGGFTYTHDGSETTSDMFTYVAGDGTGQSAEATVNITIIPVNDLPVITAIEDQTINEGGSFDPIDLNSLVSDAEDSDDLLDWDYDGNKDLLVDLNENTHVAHIRTPNNRWNGSETITFTVTDTDDDTDAEAATFTVNALDEAPVAHNDSYEVDEGATLVVNETEGVLGNDTLGDDDDGDDNDDLTAEKLTDPDHGNLTFHANGSFTYVNDGTENTSDSFTYQASDGTSTSNTATVNIHITPQNDAPVISNIPGQTINEGETFVSFNLDQYVADSDNPDDELSWSASENDNLLASIDGAHNVTIETVSDGWTGTQSITFTVWDPSGVEDSDEADFVINSSINSLPDVEDDSYTVDEGESINIPAPGVLLNDSDADDDPMTATLVSDPDFASVFDLDADGSFTYTHNGSETTIDGFTYVAEDGTGQSAVANVSISITPVNDLPVITAIGNQTINEGGTFDPIDLDNFVSDAEDTNDLLAWEAIGNTDLEVDINDDTHVARISPRNNSWSGSETITFIVTDTQEGTDSEAATFTVTELAEAPVANNDSYNVDEGSTLVVNADDGVLDNDTDGDGDNLTAIKLTDPVHGNLTFNANGSFTYVNDGSENTSDSFTYQASDGTGTSNIATVTITINPVNDIPVAQNDTYSLLEGATLNLPAPGVLQNDTDPESAELTAFKETDPSNGIVTLNPNGSFSYTHNGSETTSDAFTYRAFDGTDYSNIATVSLTITPVNENPVLGGIEGSPLAYTEGGGELPITNTLTVSDPENILSSAVVTISSNYQNGEDILSFPGGFGVTGSWNGTNGQYTLSGSTTPANYQAALRSVRYDNLSSNPVTSARTISFVVNDGALNSNTVTRNINITTTNSAPVIGDPSSDAVIFTEDAGSVQITNTLTITDIDHTNLESARVSITSGLVTTEDVLSFTPGFGITGSYNASTGILLLGGLTTKDNYRTVLRSVRYNNSNSAAPNTTNRIISFTASDGISESSPLNKTITVVGVNDPPVLAGIETTDLVYTEGSGPKQITGALTVTDVDNMISSAVIMITNYQSGQDVLTFVTDFGVSGTWNSGSGTLNLTGTASPANYQTLLRDITYSNTSANPVTITRNIRFVVNDGENSNQVMRNITFETINNAPVLADPSGTPVNFTEGGASVPLTSTITVTDVDNTNLSSATITITSGFQQGADVLSFTPSGGISGIYNASTGLLNLSGSSTLAGYQMVLRGVRYNNTSKDPGSTNRVVTFIVNDGISLSNSLLKTVTITLQNDPPVATDVIISAPNNRIGTIHTGSFTFTDPEGDSPGVSTYQWYRADNSFGNLATSIPGATGITYKTAKADGGKYISFEVTPVDEHSTSGIPVKSTFRKINAAPVATNAVISAPIPQPGEDITGSFTYSDADSDPAGTPVYHWFSYAQQPVDPPVPGTPIGNSGSVYRLVGSDADKHIRFYVTPVASSGSTPGDSIWSNIIGPIGKYTANISGSGTFCHGTTMPINLTVTGGKAPYRVILTRIGTIPKDTTISAIPSSPHTINVKIPGTYTIKELTDESGDKADISAAQPVVLTISPKAKALLTGTVSICRESDTHALLSLSFTSGTSPWSVTLRRKETLPYNDTTISNITGNPYSFMAPILGNGPTTYRILSLTDGTGCPGDISESGEAVLSYRTSPIATISGTDSICPGQSTNLTVTLTSGEQPWSFSYLRNGVHVDEIVVAANSHILQVSQPGVYTLSEVTDISGTGCGVGLANISALTPPTAILSGTSTICEHTTGNISVALTGTAPWKFSFTRNLLDSTTVENVITSPKTVPVMKSGTYRLYEVVDKNACKGTVSGSAVITVTPAPDVTMWGLKPAYNFASSEIDTAFGTPSGGTFSGPGVFGSFFIPQLAPLGTHNIVYSYRASPTSCYGYDTTVVSILLSNSVINFENDRTKYCSNDAPFTVTGVNLEGSIGFFTISGGKGLTDHDNNTATIYPDSLLPNRYTVTYTYFAGSEPFPKSADFEIGIPPTADFNWASECFHEGQSIDFINKSTSSFGYLTDTSYIWKISTNTGFDSDSLRDITYTFPKVGLYTIELRIDNSYGCSDTVVKILNMRPTYSLQTAYYEDFESNPLSWQSDYKDFPVNSWKLGKPVKHGSPLHGFSGPYTDSTCWYTQINSYPGPEEKSWVTSPCFDFTGIDKPMLTLYIWRLFNSNRDGANIQSTTDGGKTWNLVGEIGDGVNWFNTSYIRGEPGDKDNGWSNHDGVSNDAGWVRARHALDYLKGETDVQFRIAYGSDGTPQNNDGIAFDDFSIRERSKMAFIEHFTNSSSDLSLKADSTLDAFTEIFGTNVIDIQYHTSNPDGDPFYESNPMIPTSRQFYYGLSSVPYAIIDGGSENKHHIDYIKTSRPLDKNNILIQSLADSKFNIRVEAEMSENTLTAQVRIKANVVLPLIELSVRVAVIESVIDEVTGENHDTLFRNVVKAMLPDAAGTALYRSWDLTTDIPIDVSWEIENVYNRDQLRVVAFVQNEATREVYNADMDTVILATAIDDIPVTGKDRKTEFFIYPNPAQRMAMVKFSEATMDDITLELYSPLGRMMYSVQIPTGTSEVEIPVENYSNGLYLLRLTTKQKLLGIGKLMILK